MADGWAGRNVGPRRAAAVALPPPLSSSLGPTAAATSEHEHYHQNLVDHKNGSQVDCSWRRDGTRRRTDTTLDLGCKALASVSSPSVRLVYRGGTSAVAPASMPFANRQLLTRGGEGSETGYGRRSATVENGNTLQDKVRPKSKTRCSIAHVHKINSQLRLCTNNRF